MTSGGMFRGGNRELMGLARDINSLLAHKVVEVVGVRGFHEGSGLWFFEDVAYGPMVDGRHCELVADADGVFWFEGQGYVNGSQDDGGFQFMQPQPLLCSRPYAETLTDERAMAGQLLTELSVRMEELLGPDGTALALGSMLSYAAGPAVFRKYGVFPSLSIYGDRVAGKSSWCRWLMKIWGFNCKQGGIELSTSTSVGITVALSQYSNLPVWFDEYTSSCLDYVTSRLLAGCERGSAALGATMRRMGAGLVVAGDSVLNSPELRSRFCHVRLPSPCRLDEHYAWFEEKSPECSRIGRFLMRHRTEFEKLVLENLVGIERIAGSGSRAWFVQCVAAASYMALVRMTGVEAKVARAWMYGESVLRGFRTHAKQNPC